jgi:SAM-dependent methyltransferase
LSVVRTLWEKGARISMEAPQCPVCREAAARLRYRLSAFSIYTCAHCAVVYLWPLPSEAAIQATFAALYDGGPTSLPELRGYYDYCFDDAPTNPLVQTYEQWLAAVERHRPPGRLLDVGCGTGLFLAVARRRGWCVTGVDGSVEATRHARERFGLEVETGDFETLTDRGERFDAVTMWDIVEHARDPVRLLASAAGALAPGGVVGLSTPNQRSILDLVAGALYRVSGGRAVTALEKFYVDQHFLYFDPTTLTGALGRAGLVPVEVRRELTDLRRLSLAAPMRLVLQALFLLSRATGLENRLFAVARAAAARRPGQDVDTAPATVTGAGGGAPA